MEWRRSRAAEFPDRDAGLRPVGQVVVDAGGRSKAIELAFLCEPVSADRMAAWNVVNQVVADEDLYREAHALRQSACRHDVSLRDQTEITRAARIVVAAEA